MKYKELTRNRLSRYPLYLKYLILKRNSNQQTISPTEIALDLKISKESVRKDFQVISKESGLPKIGRKVDHLIRDIENFLGYHKKTNAIVIGAGNLGKAILSYKGFTDYGIELVAAFDISSNVIDKKINNIPVYSIDKIKDFKNIEVAILSVPKESAQEIADLVVKSGIKAIYNFSPIYLVVNDDVLVETVDIASSIAYLSAKRRLKGD